MKICSEVMNRVVGTTEQREQLFGNADSNDQKIKENKLELK